MKKKTFLCLSLVFVVFATLLAVRVGAFSVSQPSQEQMLSAAQQASAKTGIRAILILAVFSQESSFGVRLGKTKAEWEAYCQQWSNKYRDACICWETKDCHQDYSNAKGFLQICAALGYRTDEVKTSQTCALGLMQIEPATWLGVQSKHKEIANPWNINDAFLATGYYLAELDGTIDEKTALQKYYCGPSNFQKRKCVNYAEQVLQKAGRLSLFVAGKEPLPQLPTLPLPITPYKLQLEYPDWFPLRSDMTLVELVGTIFNLLLTVAGAATFLSIAAGGFRYLTSAGDPAKMIDAKDQVFSAITGLTLLLSSFIILNYIGPELVKLKETEPAVMTAAPEPLPPEPSVPPPILPITAINLGQMINETIKFLETNNVVKAMRELADSAEQRSSSQYCQGHTCRYVFEIKRCTECPDDSGCCKWGEIEITIAGVEITTPVCLDPCINGCCASGGLGTITKDPAKDCIPPFCSPSQAPAETCPSPNAADGIKQSIAGIRTAAAGFLDGQDQTILLLRKAEKAVNDCIADEQKVLLSCSYAKGVPDWLGPVDCEQGRDFLCVWAEGEEETAQTKYEKIAFPIEPLKQAYEAIDKAVKASEECKCKNVNCACSAQRQPPLLPSQTITRFWCQDNAATPGWGCRTKAGNPPGVYACESPCDTIDDSSPFPSGFTQKKENAKKIAGPKLGEPWLDGLRQFYAALSTMAGQTKTTEGQGVYLCEDIKSMLQSYYQNGTCPDYSVFPCCPPSVDPRGCLATDFFVCGEISGGPITPATCAGQCKDNPCSAYLDCSGLAGTCAGGKFCCQGACAEAPAGPPWPMLCDTERVPDCGATGLVQVSKQWRDATQALKDLITCIYKDTAKGARINPGPISAISDPNIPGRGGTNECDFKTCAFAATLYDQLPPKCGEQCGESNNPKVCLEKCNSWHYGHLCTALLKKERQNPSSGLPFSYAVELKYQDRISALMDAITACGGEVVHEKDHDAIMVYPDPALEDPALGIESCPD